MRHSWGNHERPADPVLARPRGGDPLYLRVVHGRAEQVSGMCCKCGVAHVTPQETAELDRLRAAQLFMSLLDVWFQKHETMSRWHYSGLVSQRLADDVAALGHRATEEGR